MPVLRPAARRFGILALAVALASLALAGCGDGSAAAGSVRVDGSSTVFPISEAAAEEYSKVSRARVNVGFSGTGGGLEKFCRGESDVSNASRPIKQGERDACAANGITDILEIQVAIDALTVLVHPQNDWVTCLDVGQVQRIFMEGGYTHWDQVDASFPSSPITRYVPGTDSGTFDYFVEAVIEGGPVEDAHHRGDVTASEDDNILAQGLQNDRNAIGYFGFAHFLEAGQSLKAIAIDGGEGCVEPTFENALDGSYQPLSRPLYIYTRQSLLENNEAIRGFVQFYVEHIPEFVPEVGYITMPEDVYREQLEKVAVAQP